MAILVECPKCKRRCSAKDKDCKCGFGLSKFSGKVYWISYSDQDKKLRRQRIGTSRQAAEQELRRVLTARAEGRHIRRSPDSTTRFKDLAVWYLELPEVLAKRSYNRDRVIIKVLLAYFGDKLLQNITPGMVEGYRQQRLATPSGRTPGTLVTPASVNREMNCLKALYNRAIGHKKAEVNPCLGLKKLKEDNERNRILSPDEYVRLLVELPEHLKPVVKLAYHSAMRKGECLGLVWDRVDLKEGFIRLTPSDCKTLSGRMVPLNIELQAMLRAMPRGLPNVPVFVYRGQAIAALGRSFTMACKRAGIEDFTFHDLRHTAINNWRLQGHDYFRIMAASGHKTMSVFKRYNTVNLDELRLLVTPNG